MRRVDQLSEMEGTRVWAAKLSDEQLIDDMWEQYRKDRNAFEKMTSGARPSLIGFTRQQAMLTSIANMIVALRMESHEGVAKATTFLPMPIFPLESVELRWKALSQRKRSQGIDAAQALWDAKVAAGVSNPYG